MAHGAEAAGAHGVESHGAASKAVGGPERRRQQKALTAVEESVPLWEDGRGPTSGIRVDGDRGSGRKRSGRREEGRTHGLGEGTLGGEGAILTQGEGLRGGSRGGGGMRAASDLKEARLVKM